MSMNLLSLHEWRFDTRVALAASCFLNYCGESFAVNVVRVGENAVHPVYKAIDKENGREILEWSSIQMAVAPYGSGTFFDIDVWNPIRTNATLVVPDLEKFEEDYDE